jgi:hypothetical protein
MRNAYKVLGGVPEGNRLLRKYSHTCVGNTVKPLFNELLGD